MEDKCKTGRVTIPTDLDVVPETLEILKKWGADAIRDCDGTDFPQQLKDADAKIYSTYYTTRKDNAWAKANPDEVQQCFFSENVKPPSFQGGNVGIVFGGQRFFRQIVFYVFVDFFNVFF